MNGLSSLWFEILPAFLAGVAITWYIADRLGRRRVREDTQGFENRLVAVTTELTAARVERARLATERQTLAKDLATSNNTIERLRAETDSLWSVVAEAREARDEAGRRLEALRREVAVAEKRATATSVDAEQLAASDRKLLAEQSQAAAARMTELTAAKNRAEADRTRALLQIDALEQQLRQAVEAGRTERERLEANRSMAVAQLRDLKRQLDAAARERDAAVAERDQLHAELATALARAAEHDALRRAGQVEHQEEQARAAAQIGALQAQADRIEPLRRQVADREELLRSVARERDDAAAALVRRERELLARLERLEKQAGDRNRLAKQVAERDARIAELDARIGALGRERDDRAAAERRALTRIESLKAEIKDRDIRFRALLDDRRTFVETNRSEVARLREDLTRAKLQGAGGRNGADHPPSNGHHPLVDDLTRISGIGPAIERALRRNGIHTFEQIARWTDEDIARIARALGARGSRIKRDRWVEQARLEHERQYGGAIGE